MHFHYSPAGMCFPWPPPWRQYARKNVTLSMHSIFRVSKRTRQPWRLPTFCGYRSALVSICSSAINQRAQTRLTKSLVECLPGSRFCCILKAKLAGSGRIGVHVTKLAKSFVGDPKVCPSRCLMKICLASARYSVQNTEYG